MSATDDRPASTDDTDDARELEIATYVREVVERWHAGVFQFPDLSRLLVSAATLAEAPYYDEGAQVRKHRADRALDRLRKAAGHED